MRVITVLASSGVIRALGANAPIPPVFGPRSPSQIRLWSSAVDNGTACSPSQSTKNETSGPVRHSSITSLDPAAPNWPSSIAARTARSASCAILGHHDALACGKTVGLDDDREAEVWTRNRLERVLDPVTDDESRGRNPVPRHELLGEHLGPLEGGGGSRRTNDRASTLAELVSKSFF